MQRWTLTHPRCPGGDGFSGNLQVSLQPSAAGRLRTGASGRDEIFSPLAQIRYVGRRFSQACIILHEQLYYTGSGAPCQVLVFSFSDQGLGCPRSGAPRCFIKIASRSLNFVEEPHAVRLTASQTPWTWTGWWEAPLHGSTSRSQPAFADPAASAAHVPVLPVYDPASHKPPALRPPTRSAV